jgi:seryl-tRNA(Sec) selenium transferase
VDQCLESEAGTLPVMEMLRASRAFLLARAEKITAALSGSALKASIGEGTAQAGGGTLPRSTVASVTINISPLGLPLEIFSQRLRLAAIPVVGSITKNHFKINLRTVFPHQDDDLVQGILTAIAEPSTLS